MIEDMQSNLDCPSADKVTFIDMNGDGLDDLVCIGNRGELYVSINQGDGDVKGRRPPSFQNIGKVKDSETVDGQNVFISDIDGDGRGDYGVIAADGTLSFWRNGGTGDKPGYWQALGVIRRVPANERFSDPRSRYRGVDLNGDVSLWQIPSPKPKTFPKALGKANEICLQILGPGRLFDCRRMGQDNDSHQLPKLQERQGWKRAQGGLASRPASVWGH